MLPPEIWNRILYFAFITKEPYSGRIPDIFTLENCRRVCRDWNEMIKRSVWLKPTKEWGIITKRMIEANWIPWNWKKGVRSVHKKWLPGGYPTEKMISHAKGLGKSNKKQIFCK